MRKKIILQVDKLIQRQARREPIQPPLRVFPEKKHSFDQMYREAKRNQNRHGPTHPHAPPYHSATNGFQNVYQSLRASRNTPNNTHRMQQQNQREKLNRSLESKPTHADRGSPVKRSTSSEKSRLAERKMKDVHEKPRKGSKDENGKTQGNFQHAEWQGLEQFEREWKSAISSLDHSKHEHLRETQCFLSLAEIFQILRTLHYLRKVEDERLLVSLWKELQGETYGGIPSNNLREFLTIINYCPANICYHNDKNSHNNSQKRIGIDGNLKIVVSPSARIQIYQEYLALRVNRILYGSAAVSHFQQSQSSQSQKQGKPSGNIKIEEQDHSKKKIVLGTSKKAGDRHSKPHLARQKRSEQITRISQSEQKQEREHNDDTICYSQFSQGKQSAKLLTSNESDHSISNQDIIEEVVIKRPILSVDVNLGDGLCEKLTVFQGETALEVSNRLVEKYNIDESLRSKFQAMLGSHIRNLLYRIDEVSQEMFSDREE